MSGQLSAFMRQDHPALHSLAAELARPIAKGWIRPEHALAALIAAARRAVVRPRQTDPDTAP